MQQNNEMDHKSFKNCGVGVGKLNIPVLNKSVTVEVQKLEIEVAASLRCDAQQQLLIIEVK